MKGKKMNFQYQIGCDEALSRWQITTMEKAPFVSPKQTFQAEVNLEESYVQVVYPVREEFLRQNRIEQVQMYEGEYDNLYFPFENNRIDLSAFIHTPHHIWVHAMTGVLVEEPGDYPFEIYTCGGVKVWVNGRLAECFAPYTRNIAGRKRVTLPFRAGYNEIKVYADELAERDVFFYFEFRYKGSNPITGQVDVKEDPETIRRAESFLSSCYFERDMYTKGEAKLCYDPSLLDGDTKLYVSSDFRGTGGQKDDGGCRTVMARKEQDYLVYCNVEESGIQISNVYLCMDVGPYEISRRLFVGIIPEKTVTMEPAGTIKERKRQALGFLHAHGEMGMQAVISSLELEGVLDDKAKTALDLCLRKIEGREDCSDFSLAPMAILLTRYEDKLSQGEKERIRQAVLHFRYWIDEPGDDVMWYFSENHAFLFHISQYLWGHQYPEEIFTESGRPGAVQEEYGRRRVEQWFDVFFRYGYAEWNSATYIPIDFIGFFTLYLCAPDQRIKDMAKRALDFSLRIVAYHSFQGVMNSTCGRIYENTIKTRIQSETNFISWVSFGVGYLTFFGNSVHLYAISDYEPEDFAAECRVKEGEGLIQEIDQGILRVKINTYRTKDYLTSAVRRFKPFRHGHQQHLMNVALGEHRGALFYVNHPGERLFSGENRPSYWAGNGTMPWIERYENVTVMIFDIDPHELVHRIHAYVPLYEYDEYCCTEYAFAARAEDGYVWAWFSNPVSLTEKGANTRKELVSQGLKHGVIVKCGSRKEFGGFQAFKEAMEASNPWWNGDKSLGFKDPQYGVILVNDTKWFGVDGKEVAFQPQDGFRLDFVNLVKNDVKQ